MLFYGRLSRVEGRAWTEAVHLTNPTVLGQGCGCKNGLVGWGGALPGFSFEM